MAWKEFSFELPEFLFATVPGIDGSFNDIRTWLYHTPSFTLVEISFVNDLIGFDVESRECFVYINIDGELEWYVVILTKSEDSKVEIDERELIEKAKSFYIKYLDENDEKYGL